MPRAGAKPDAPLFEPSGCALENDSFGAPSRSEMRSDLSWEEDTLLETELSPRRPFWEPHAKFMYESLDYAEVENDLLREDRERKLREERTPFRRRLAHVTGDWQRWMLLLAIGILTGLTAFGIDKGIDGITSKKWSVVGDQMGSDDSDSIPFWTPFFIFVGINLGLCLVATLFVCLEPLAAGSGIPEVKCYLNGVRVYRIARLRTLIAKGGGILFSVASGLPCGKEGPMIHSGAVIGGGVATGKSSKLHFDTGLFKEYRGDRDKRMFVAAGAAAGVAAAFGAPVGGVLFAVEEACSWWSLNMSMQIFFCAAASAATLNLCMKWNDPQTPASGQTNFGQMTASYTLLELPLCALLGALGGLVGALFNYLNIRLTHLRKQYIRGIPLRRVGEALAINLLVSTMLFVLTSRLYTCQPVSQMEIDVPKDDPGDTSYVRRYGCSDPDSYNDMATYFFSQTEASIRHLFHSGQPFAYSSLLAHFVPSFFLTVLTYGIAVPSGLFLPCLSLGAGLGRIFAQVMTDVFSCSGLHFGVYSAFGAAAVLGGVIRMTVSLSVIVMEASGNATYIVPLMIISCTAKWVGDLFNHGIYDEHIMFNRVPLMEESLDDPRLTTLTAHHVMNRTTVPMLSEQPTAEQVLLLLSRFEDHNGFLVTEDGKASSQVSGLILRRWLMILIRRGAYGRDADSLVSADFVKSANERDLLKVEKYAVLSVPTESLQDRLNLRRYMDRHPFTVYESTPLPRVYSLFRSMGLRHLVVTDRSGCPKGMICRKNLVHLRERREGEQRVDPKDGKLKPRDAFGDAHNWVHARTHVEAFEEGRHPSRQRLVSFSNLVQTSPACAVCRGTGRRRVCLSFRRNCDACGGLGTLPAGCYFTVGESQRLKGDVFVDPHTDDDGGAKSPQRPSSRPLRLDCSEHGIVATL